MCLRLLIWGVTYEIEEELTRRFCTGTPVTPVVQKTWRMVEQTLVGSALYAKMQAIVNVAYVAKGCSRTRVDTFVEEFWVAFPGATNASSIAFVDTDGVQEPALLAETCCCTARGVRDVGNIVFTFTAG